MIFHLVLTYSKSERGDSELKKCTFTWRCYHGRNHGSQTDAFLIVSYAESVQMGRSILLNFPITLMKNNNIRMSGNPGGTRSHGASRNGRDMSNSTDVPNMAVAFAHGSLIRIDGHLPYGAQ